MKKLVLALNRTILVLLFLLFNHAVFSQTAPTPTTLNFSYNFGTTTFTTLPATFAVWNGVSGGSTNSQSAAESSVPTGNGTITAQTAVTTTGGAFGYAPTASNDARFYVQTSSNTTNGVNQLAMAINTTGKTNVQISYTIEIVSAQPRTVGVVLQYRIGTSGSWTTQTGTLNPFSQAGGTTGNKGTASVTLPAAVDNQANVQIRWAIWRGSETGNSSGLAIDNINVTASAAAPSITVSTTSIPDFGNVLVGNSSTEATYTVQGTNLGSNLAIAAPSGFEISESSGTGFGSSLSLTPAAVSTVKTIYVRFTPTGTGPAGGDIEHTSTGAAQKNVAVSGTGTSCSAPTITPGGPTTFCSGGSVTLTASAGASYLWSNSETTQSILVTTSGNYTVSVTDNSNCTATSTATTVTVNAFTYTGTIYSENMGVPGANTDVNLWNGWQNNGVFNFSSTTPLQPQVRTTSPSTGYAGASSGGNIFFGTSSLGNARNFIVSGFNTLNYTGLQLSYGIRRESLLGSSVLSVSVSTDGNTYTPLSAPSITTSGQWSLATPTGTIPATANLYIKFEKTDTSSWRIDDIQLSGTANGIAITAQGNTTLCQGKQIALLSNVPTGNEWSPNFAFDQAVFVGDADTYFVTATDINGCTAVSNSITISVIPSPTATTSQTEVLCSGGATGTITAIPSGGTMPYSYNWNTSPVQNTETAINLLAGNYTVTVTDVNGCTATATASLIDPDPLFSSASGTNPSFIGAMDGTATATATGGTPSYDFHWDVNNLNGTSFSVSVAPKTAAHPFDGLGSGHGYVIDGVEGKELTLMRGITYTFNVNTPGHPFHISTDDEGGNTANEITDGVTDSQTTNGVLTFTPNSSHPSLLYYTCAVHTYMGYKINIVDGVNSASLTGIGQGTYTVIATDANGCTSVSQVILVDPLPEIFVSTTSLAPFANTVVGQSSAEQSYTVSAINLADPVIVSAPAGFEISEFSGTGFTNSLSLSPAALSTPLTIYVRFTPVSTGPAGGNIEHTSTGAAQKNVAVSGNGISCPQANITPSGPTTFCQGGSVTLTASSGDTYLWSTNETTQSIVVTTAATYSVVVTDAQNCSSTSANVTVTVNTFSFNGTILSENVGAPSGTTALNTYNGWQNFGVFNFTTTTTNPSDIRNTTVSTGYTGASGGGNVFMGTAGGTNPRDLIISGINTLGYSSLSFSFGMLRTATTEAIAVSVSSDSINYTPLTTSTQPAQNTWALITTTGTIPATGNLRIKFEKATGVSFRLDDFKLTGTTSSVHAFAQGPVALCPGGQVKLMSNMPSGNTWTPGASTARSLIASASGSYYTTVTDGNGCSASSSPINVIVNTPPVVTTSDSPVSCFGGNDGSATANATGTLPFSYNWNTAPIQSTQTATGLSAGSYTVTVTDGNSCTATATAIITQPAQIVISSFNPTFGQVGATIVISGSGFTGATDVRFNGTSASYTVDSDIQITATVPSGATSGTISVHNNTCTGTSAGSFTVAPANVVLNLKVYIQGLYRTASTLNSTLFNLGISGSSSDVDTIVVELMNPSNTSQVIASYKGVLQSDGTLQCTYPGSVFAGTYYVRVLHRNSLETWSASALSFSSATISFDFTTSAGQAYGANQVEVESGKFAMWSGDISNSVSYGTQDGLINDFDFNLMEGVIPAFNTGYGSGPADLDGDGIIDAADYSLLENNLQFGLIKMHP